MEMPPRMVVHCISNEGTIFVPLSILPQFDSNFSKELEPFIGRIPSIEEIRYLQNIVAFLRHEEGKITETSKALLSLAFRHYLRNRREGIKWAQYCLFYPSKTLMLKACCTPQNYDSYLKEVDNIPIMCPFPSEKYQVEYILQNEPIGRWLIRKSSMNRALDLVKASKGSEEEKEFIRDVQDKIKRFQIEFYAISWKGPRKISHRRFVSMPGKGWCYLRNAYNYDMTANPPELRGIWFDNFIDCFEYMQEILRLKLEDKKQGYTPSDIGTKYEEFEG